MAAIGWQKIQGVLPEDSWDRRQHTSDPRGDKQIRKWMEIKHGSLSVLNVKMTILVKGPKSSMANSDV